MTYPTVDGSYWWTSLTRSTASLFSGNLSSSDFPGMVLALHTGHSFFELELWKPLRQTRQKVWLQDSPRGSVNSCRHMPQVIVSFTSSSWILELLSAIADENIGGCEVSQCLVILTNMSAGNLSKKTSISKQSRIKIWLLQYCLWIFVVNESVPFDKPAALWAVCC